MESQELHGVKCKQGCIKPSATRLVQDLQEMGLIRVVCSLCLLRGMAIGRTAITLIASD